MYIRNGVGRIRKRHKYIRSIINLTMRINKKVDPTALSRRKSAMDQHDLSYDRDFVTEFFNNESS